MLLLLQRGGPTLPCKWLQGLLELLVKWFSSLNRQGTNHLFFIYIFKSFVLRIRVLYTGGSDQSKVLCKPTVNTLFMELLPSASSRAGKRECVYVFMPRLWRISFVGWLPIFFAQ